MTTKAEQMTGLKLMRAEFPPNQISKMCRSTKKDNAKGKCNKCGGWHGLPAIQLDYVGHAALTDRLLECDPAWTWEPLSLGPDGYPVIDKDGGMWIKLTVCGVTRLGYGDAQGKTGGDAMKERIGDALRNAAMRFGAALDLWHKGDLHAHIEGPEEQETKEAEQKKRDDLFKIAADVTALFDTEGAGAAMHLLNGKELSSEDKRVVWDQLPEMMKTALKSLSAAHAQRA